MRKVVDSNFLQKEEFDKYLSSSANNYAVLTDYASMEAYKGDTLKSIYKSMNILSKYPSQVIVLKTTQIVCGLKFARKGLQKKLIDRSQTQEFTAYCKQLKQAELGDSRYLSSILEHGREANSHMKRMLDDASLVSDSIDLITKTFSQSELNIFRKKKVFTEDLLSKIVRHAMEISVIIFSKHPRIEAIPKFEELFNLFIFRYSLCTYLLVLDWISEGGANNVKPENMRNDMIDMTFAAYATYFDGLLTHDDKLKRILRDAEFILSNAICTQSITKPV